MCTCRTRQRKQQRPLHHNNNGRVTERVYTALMLHTVMVICAQADSASTDTLHSPTHFSISKHHPHDMQHENAILMYDTESGIEHRTSRGQYFAGAPQPVHTRNLRMVEEADRCIDMNQSFVTEYNITKTDCIVVHM